MVGRVKLHPVDALAKPVVRQQPGAITVGVECPLVDTAAGQAPVGGELPEVRTGTFRDHRLAQDDVAKPQVSRCERGWLVLDLVGLPGRAVEPRAIESGVVKPGALKPGVLK